MIIRESILLIVLYSLLNIISASAQANKDSFLVGGDGSLRYSFLEYGPNTLRGEINPRGGYFLGNNFVIGLSVPVSFSSRTSTSNSRFSSVFNGTLVEIEKMATTEYGIAPFFRTYFGQTKFRPFLQGQLNYLNTVNTTRFFDTPVPLIKTTRTDISANIGIGLTYFISEYIGLEIIPNVNLGLNNLNSSSFVGLNVGVQFYLPKKSNKP
jgi:hypothetical protein